MGETMGSLQFLSCETAVFMREDGGLVSRQGAWRCASSSPCLISGSLHCLPTAAVTPATALSLPKPP